MQNCLIWSRVVGFQMHPIIGLRIDHSDCRSASLVCSLEMNPYAGAWLAMPLSRIHTSDSRLGCGAAMPLSQSRDTEQAAELCFGPNSGQNSTLGQKGSPFTL